MYIIFKSREQFTQLKNIEIVIARYNENLKWLNNSPFNNYPITCYNKGINSLFKIEGNHEIVKLPNVGRCDHTYLYHIVNNYDTLADFTVFLPGSNDLPYKLLKSKLLIKEIEKNNKTVFIGQKYDNVKDMLNNFSMTKHKCAYSENNELHKESILEKSKIRPYGKWYEHHFGNRFTNFITYWGILAVSKKDIQQHPVSYYNKFLKELETSSNPEVGHYIERSWCAIFYPLNDAIFININSIPDLQQYAV